MLSKKKLIRILALFTMAVLFLPIFSFNFPQSIFFLRSFYFIAATWIVVVLWLVPQFYVSKYIWVFVTIGLIYFIGINTFWSERIVMSQKITFFWSIRDIQGAFLAVIMYFSFIMVKDYKGLANVSFLTLFFILITSITSIIGINLNPGVVRLMATSIGAGEMHLFHRQSGIGEYSEFASMIFLMPTLVFFLKNEKSLIKIKVLVIIIILVFVYALYKSEFTTALMLSIMLILMSFLLKKGFKHSMVIISFIFGILMFVFNNQVASIFYYISENFAEGTIIANRLVDVGQIFELADYTPGSEETYFTKTRLTLSMESVNAFLVNPLIGSTWGGGHATWLDRLGAFGLLGFFPWIIIFGQQVILNLRLLDKRSQGFYLLTILGCVFLGLITTQANSVHTLLIVFFVVPGLLGSVQSRGE
jgi:hypothetical protein